VLIVLAAWEAVARLGWVDPLFVPAPTAVAAAFLRMGRGAPAGLGDTLAKTAVAYVLSVTLGVGLGIAIGSVRALRDVLSPFVVVLYGMPKILVLPWIVLLLGFGTTPAIVYGTIHGLFPVLVLVMGGVRDVDRTLVTGLLGASACSCTGRCCFRRSCRPCWRDAAGHRFACSASDRRDVCGVRYGTCWARSPTAEPQSSSPPLRWSRPRPSPSFSAWTRSTSGSRAGVDDPPDHARF
jgi:hypothetical protein